MKKRRLAFPKRWVESAARAERHRSVNGNVCDFKTDFVLVRDEHYRITIWSKLEDEISFIVGPCEALGPVRQCTFDRFANAALVSGDCRHVSQCFKQVCNVVCRGGSLWTALVRAQKDPG